MQSKIKLHPEKIIIIIDTLEKRISERFPNSSLQKTCADFLGIAKETKNKIDWISKPNLTLRLFSYLIILLGLGGIVFAVSNVNLKVNDTTFENMIALSESVFNDIILLGAAIFFLANTESRIKRKRAIKSLNE
jgi:heme/copper-type cytochrome/quinol oxidase subunit 1